MTAILDPGALLAAKSMSPEGVLPPLPRAPLVPNPMPGAARARAVRRAVGRALAALRVDRRPAVRVDEAPCGLATQR
jgi:hypothetical protein